MYLTQSFTIRPKHRIYNKHIVLIIIIIILGILDINRCTRIYYENYFIVNVRLHIILMYDAVHSKRTKTT